MRAWVGSGQDLVWRSSVSKARHRATRCAPFWNLLTLLVFAQLSSLHGSAPCTSAGSSQLGGVTQLVLTNRRDIDVKCDAAPLRQLTQCVAVLEYAPGCSGELRVTRARGSVLPDFPCEVITARIASVKAQALGDVQQLKMAVDVAALCRWHRQQVQNCPSCRLYFVAACVAYDAHTDGKDDSALELCGAPYRYGVDVVPQGAAVSNSPAGEPAQHTQPGSQAEHGGANGTRTGADAWEAVLQGGGPAASGAAAAAGGTPAATGGPALVVRQADTPSQPAGPTLPLILLVTLLPASLVVAALLLWLARARRVLCFKRRGRSWSIKQHDLAPAAASTMATRFLGQKTSVIVDGGLHSDDGSPHSVFDEGHGAAVHTARSRTPPSSPPQLSPPGLGPAVQTPFQVANTEARTAIGSGEGVAASVPGVLVHVGTKEVLLEYPQLQAGDQVVLQMGGSVCVPVTLTSGLQHVRLSTKTPPGNPKPAQADP